MSKELEIEQLSMRVSAWANLAMAGAGLFVGLVAFSNAIILDGLFSGLNVLMAVVAIRVAAQARRLPDSERPFGYAIDETIFVLFRSMLLIGIILMAAFSAASGIFSYVKTGEAQEVVLSWIGGYVAVMAVVCLALYLFHRWNWGRSGRTSDILRTEAKSALIDGAMSIGAGAAFLLIAVLKGGPLDPLVPISDSIVVLVLCIVLLPGPVGIFRQALGDMAGVSLDKELVDSIKSEAVECLKGSAFEVLEVGAVRNGRLRFILAYLRCTRAVLQTEIDQARRMLAARSSPHSVEIVLSGSVPFGQGDGAANTG